MTLRKKPIENIVGKGEHFLCFLPFFTPSVTFILSSAIMFKLDRSRILPFGTELKYTVKPV